MTHLRTLFAAAATLLVTLLVAGCATTRPVIPDNVESMCMGCEQRPELLNSDEVDRARQQALRELGESRQERPGDRREYRTEYRILVGEDGRVLRVEILISSGDPMLDQAIRRWASVGRYSPAIRNGRPLPLWIRQGFSYGRSG